MSTVAMKVLEVKRPCSGERIGYRIVLAHPNKARYNVFADEYTQSFDSKYRLRESGDTSEYPNPLKIQRFLQESMRWHNIDRIVTY